MTKLRLQDQRCEFRNATEIQQRLTEQLVIGVRDSIVQDWMLSQDKSMSLEAAINHVRIHEAKLADIASFRQPQNCAMVNLVTRRHNAPRRNNAPTHAPPHSSTSHHDHTSCPNCTTTHEPGRKSCPARNSKCRKCNREGHWAAKCRLEHHPNQTRHHHDVNTNETFDKITSCDEAYTDIRFNHPTLNAELRSTRVHK